MSHSPGEARLLRQFDNDDSRPISVLLLVSQEEEEQEQEAQNCHSHTRKQ